MYGILQVRMGSARLWGKALLAISGRPVISYNLERLRRAQTLTGLVVATSTSPADDVVEAWAASEGVTVFRGHPDDVLDRIYHCARHLRLSEFAKFTADNPLIDPAVVDQVVGSFLAHPGEYDYVSNNHPATWQDGQEVEVISFSALSTAWQEASRPFQREHVTPFIWDQPHRFRLANVARRTDDWYRQYRWTLDYPEDFHFVRRVYEELYPASPTFDTIELMCFLDARPDITALNAARRGEVWYAANSSELQTYGTIDKGEK